MANLRVDFHHLENKLNTINSDLKAGIAGSTAIANLPQAFRNGQSMVSVAVGSYRVNLQRHLVLVVWRKIHLSSSKHPVVLIHKVISTSEPVLVGDGNFIIICQCNEYGKLKLTVFYVFSILLYPLFFYPYFLLSTFSCKR